jgi:anti-sigma-K factor RskA
MEHNDQKFRLSYILGHLQPEKRSRSSAELEDEDDLEDVVEERHEGAGATPEELEAMSRFLVWRA